MTKVAVLVEVSFTVRLIVDVEATNEEIIPLLYPLIQDRLDNREVGDNLVSVEEDIECPYDPTTDDKK